MSESHAAASYINVHNAVCEEASDYTKKKHVLRVRLFDAAEYLFVAASQNEMYKWIDRINFAAGK